MNLLSALLPKAAFVGAFAAAVVGISTFGSLVPPHEHSLLGFTFGAHAGATPRCVAVMERAYRHLDADGIWDCFTPKLQQGFFSNSGLQGNAAVRAKLFAKYKDSGVSVDVQSYMHNPVCAVPSGSQQQACNAWLLYLTPIVENIPQDASSGSLTIFIDPNGLIWALA